MLLYRAVEVLRAERAETDTETGDGRMRNDIVFVVLKLRNVEVRWPDTDIDVAMLAILGKECGRKG